MAVATDQTTNGYASSQGTK